jgi:ADA HAT complex component 1
MDKASFQKARQMPHVDIPLLNKLKRKRTDSPEPSPTISPTPQLVKKWKGAHPDAKSAVAVDAAAPSCLPLPPFQAATAAPESPAVVQSSRKSYAPVTNSGVNALQTGMSSVNVNQAGSNASFSSAKPSQPLLHASSASAKPSTVDVDPHVKMEGHMSKLQQTIEAQFNHQILLKHNELRLIEQELAKCQVQYEQLRRCSLIPYPGTNGFSEDVSLGKGAALRPAQGYTRPRNPAPWGVVDGPYTRHYARWLLPDAEFDSVPEPPSYFYSENMRATRGNALLEMNYGKPRSSRTGTLPLKLQALGEQHPQTPKADPLLLKRSTDGVWVRLFCEKCNHGNFSNTQGFLNHCRIKHHQMFKTHDEAAIACGRPVDPNEAPAATPVPAKDPLNAPTPSTSVPTPAPATGTIHPLIQSNPPTIAEPVPPRKLQPKTPSNELPASAADYFTPGIRGTGTTASPANGFVPSPQTPNLAALLDKRGFGMNLDNLVKEARVRTDFSAIESPASDDEGTPPASATAPKGHLGLAMARLPSSHSHSHPQHHPHAFGPLRGPAKSSQRPVSRKGHTGVGHKVNMNTPAPLPLENSTGSDVTHTAISVSRDRADSEPADLSPNTVESSNPGLVSDHDGDDDEDEDMDVEDENVALAVGVKGHKSGLRDFEGDVVMVEYGSDDGMSRHGKGEELCTKGGSSKC